MKKFFKWAGLALLALIFIYTFVFLYQKSQPQVVQYELCAVDTGDLVKSTVVTGKVEPRVEVSIKPQISGIIAELNKQAGQKVEMNEVIAKVKVIPDMSSLNSAESRLRLATISMEQAKTDFERMQNLYDKKLISSEDYEKSRNSLLNAKEELAGATDALSIVKEGYAKSDAKSSNTLVRSTINGLILDIPVKVGNSVILSNTFNDGTTIATVADMNDLLFVGNIDETEVGRISEGMPVKISLGALQNVVIDAVLEYISPKGVNTNGANQFEIKAALKVPQNVTIRSGYSANATIELARASHVLAIPESTVEYSGDSAFVYVLTDSVPQQKFVRRAITTGMSDGLKIEVKSGLKQGEKLRGLPVSDEKTTATH